MTEKKSKKFLTKCKHTRQKQEIKSYCQVKPDLLSQLVTLTATHYSLITKIFIPAQQIKMDCRENQRFSRSDRGKLISVT